MKRYRIRSKGSSNWRCYGQTAEILETDDPALAQSWVDEGHDYCHEDEVVDMVAHLETLLRRIQKDGYDPLWRIAEDVTEAIGPEQCVSCGQLKCYCSTCQGCSKPIDSCICSQSDAATEQK